MNQDYLKSEEGLEEFSARFEGGTLPKEQFTHAAHVAVCCLHLFNEDADTALERLRVLIPKFNESVGGQNTDSAGYHETITVFWVRVLAEFYRTKDWESRLGFVREGIAEFGDRRGLHADYYSFDVVKSKEARRTWIAPDRRAIELPSAQNTR
jgi:hypothetical protein